MREELEERLNGLGLCLEECLLLHLVLLALLKTEILYLLPNSCHSHGKEAVSQGQYPAQLPGSRVGYVHHAQLAIKDMLVCPMCRRVPLGLIQRIRCVLRGERSPVEGAGALARLCVMFDEYAPVEETVSHVLSGLVIGPQSDQLCFGHGARRSSLLFPIALKASYNIRQLGGKLV